MKVYDLTFGLSDRFGLHQRADITMTDIAAAENAPGTSTPVLETQQVKNAAADAKGGQTGGGGKKKKKGKK